MEIPLEVKDINSITIPEKCKNCAYQTMFREQSLEYATKLLINQRIGLELVGDPGQQFDTMINEAMPEDAQDVQTSFRQMIAKTIKRCDGNLDFIQTEIEANSRSCDGTITTSFEHNGVTYIGHVCTSANINTRKQTNTAIIKLELD